MNDVQLFSLLGRATADVWGDLSRDLQEAIFELATRNAPELRTDLATYLHDRHPRTQHPPRPSAVV
jgi:hypothetical protein